MRQLSHDDILSPYLDERKISLKSKSKKTEGDKMANIGLSTLEIKSWAKERNLHYADPNKQMLKLMEEVGELAEGMAKSKNEQIVDSIGDVYVVLTILSMQLGLNIEDCVNEAYNEIANRKGKMINGVFVKESDYKNCPHGPEPQYCPLCKGDE